MSIKDVRWSLSEKEIAKAAFETAYKKEMDEIKNMVYDKVASLKEDKDIWELYNYLTDRKKSIDKKYDYRYSKLLLIFGLLMNEGYLTTQDLSGLSEEKLKIISTIAGFDDYLI